MGHTQDDNGTAQLIRLDTGQAFEQARPVFERIHSQDRTAGIHLSWSWLRRLFRDYAGRCRIYAYAPSGSFEDAAAVLPLRRDLHWSETRQEFVTRYAAMGMLNIADYTGFVCSDERVIPALARQLQNEPWARLSLRYEATGVRAHSFAQGFDTVAVNWPANLSSGGKIDNLVCPRIPVVGSTDEYVTSLDGKMRKKFRRAERQALLMGATIRQSAPHEQPEHLELILTHWARFWDGKKDDETRDRLGSRYRQYLTRAMELGSLSLTTLWIGERFVGGTANLVDDKLGVLHSVVEGRDDRAGIDIGILLAVEMMRIAAEMGLDWIDLGHGNYAYKYRLGAHDRNVSYLTLRRRSRWKGPLFDPAMAPMAIEATREFIKNGENEKAHAALVQLRGLVSSYH